MLASEPKTSGIRYEPWRGTNYGTDSILGMPVLIIGEYWYHGCVDDAALTQRVFNDRAAGIGRDHFDRSIASAILGRDVSQSAQDEHGALWNSVAIYNYIRHLLPRPTARPDEWMYREPEALAAFREVLAKLNPRCVLMFAQTTWNLLPADYAIADPEACRSVGRGCGWYQTQGAGFALAIGLNHPSAWNRKRQTWRDWHPFIHRALEYARRVGPPGPGFSNTMVG